jgi:hypothetical protein
MGAMRVARVGKSKMLSAHFLALVITVSVFHPIPAPAISFNSSPARIWGHIYASPKISTEILTPQRSAKLEGEVKSQWQVTYSGFPDDAKIAVQYAIDIWSRNFSSKVPISVEATWEKSGNINTLGSARPGYYFNAFPGAPDDNLWYPSALANTLAERDLAPNQKEIFLSINSTPLWYKGIDGQPSPASYDLVSVVLHEIAHGLGFLSNAEYDKFFGTGYIFQPTPFDAYVQLPDGRTFVDFCSRSAELGKAMLGPLSWSGQSGIVSNGGVRPKLYTPNPFVDGSSITHLDEETFSKSLSNSTMTPNLEPGEVFRSPGPIALAMIEDMLRKPPAGNATGVPAKPINLKALIGDEYALLTFDSLNCNRVDRITNYLVTIKPGGETRSFRSTPIRVNGLKNGKSYRFTLVAENDKGRSEPVESNSVKPKSSGTLTVIDNYSKVSRLAATDYRGTKVIVYGDESTQTLKIATLRGKRWTLSTIRRGVDVGPVSLCTSGVGSKQALHIFYGELQRQDLLHSTNSSGKWMHETIDGNADEVQDYREEERARTASNVSVSNACAVTSAGLQVFYRDETQGILLGAVKTKKGWVYEIVDGDRNTDNRTSGDVAFSLAATTNKDLVFLIYDSVLTVNSSKQATQGEVRTATRKTAFPEDWKYKTLDGPDNGTAVAGYAVAATIKSDSIFATWLSARGDTLPNPSQVKLYSSDKFDSTSNLNTVDFGVPSSPLAIDSRGLVFGCQSRICKARLPNPLAQLASGSNRFSRVGYILSISRVRYVVTTSNQKVVMVTL